MPIQKTLKTWAGRSLFKYSGSIQEGTTIYYGEQFKYRKIISRHQYIALINHFAGQRLETGTSRTNPPKGSVGEWLQENVTKTAIASYICHILIEHKIGERVGRTEIKIFQMKI